MPAKQIPNPVLSGRGKCEKLTKINILHVTINYIRAMENILTTGDSGVHSYSEGRFTCDVHGTAKADIQGDTSGR